MLRPLRILVVDDDITTLQVIGLYLDSRGHSVVTAESGLEALEALEEHTFDLIVSDVQMAGMDGFELLKAVRKRAPEVGFILMTAYEEKYPLSEALEAGADGYISKPFSLSKFSLILEEEYWNALSRQDWWAEHSVEEPA
jgi:CheY-like chemotaxis protein